MLFIETMSVSVMDTLKYHFATKFDVITILKIS